MREFHHDHGLIIVAHSGSEKMLAMHSFELPNGAAEWVQLMPLGVFHGRDGRGPYKIASKPDAEKVITASLARAAGMDLVVDYDHQTDLAAVAGVGGNAPAAGWIKELQARDDGIYGRIEWTEAAKAKLNAKEYRYISPVYLHAPTGSVSLVLRAGLTNNPNLEIAAVAAALNNPHEDDMDFIAKLRKALGLPETASEAEVLAHASLSQLHSTSFVALATAAALKLDDKQETITAAAAKIGSKVKGFDEAAKAAGLKPEDKPEQLVVAINAQIAGVIDPAKFVPADQVAALQSQLNELKASVNSDKAEAAVDLAIQSGKLVPALRAWGLSLHAVSPAEFDAFVKAAPVVLKPGTSDLLAVSGAGEDGLTEDERAICSQLGIAAADYIKNKPKEA